MLTTSLAQYQQTTTSLDAPVLYPSKVAVYVCMRYMATVLMSAYIHRLHVVEWNATGNFVLRKGVYIFMGAYTNTDSQDGMEHESPLTPLTDTLVCAPAQSILLYKHMRVYVHRASDPHGFLTYNIHVCMLA